MSWLVSLALAHSVDAGSVHIVQQGQRIWLDAGVEADLEGLDERVGFVDEHGTEAVRGLTDLLQTEHGPVLRVQYRLPAPPAALQLRWELAAEPTTVLFSDGTETVQAVVSRDQTRVQLYGAMAPTGWSPWTWTAIGLLGGLIGLLQTRSGRAPQPG